MPIDIAYPERYLRYSYRVLEAQAAPSEISVSAIQFALMSAVSQFVTEIQSSPHILVKSEERWQ